MKQLALLVLLSAAGAAAAQEAPNTIKAGMVFTTDALGAVAEYERLLVNGVSAGIRYASVDYTWKDRSYTEEGAVKGVDVTLRYYFERSGFRGFYLGGSLGAYKSDWDWRDPAGTPTRGNGASTLWHLGGTAGYKYFMTPELYVDGYVMVGRWEGHSTTESSGTRKSQLSGYAAMGLGVGLVF